MSNKTAILYFDYPSTSGNHAGMAYLALNLAKILRDAKAIRQPRGDYKGGLIIRWMHAVAVAFYLRLSLSKGDNLFLLEYGTPTIFHSLVARICNFLGRDFNLYGMVHLSYRHLREQYSDEKILEEMKHLDEVIVLGSSLKRDLENAGCDNVIKSFHYVDTAYYSPTPIRPLTRDRLRVICMGALKRDMQQLLAIVRLCPNIEFSICGGRANIAPLFDDCKNVKVFGYLAEDKLRELMRISHVSLSVLDDTIGSNVICTSLAVGLINVVSDVGSIRDYCSDENSFFFSDTDECAGILNNLDGKIDLLYNMRFSAIRRAEELSLTNFGLWLEKHMLRRKKI